MNQTPSTEQIKSEILKRFGSVPSFFLLALPTPDVAADLWRHTESAYLGNPIPFGFKERLFLYLSRYCRVSYCLGRHSAMLLSPNEAQGGTLEDVLTSGQILTMLEKPAPNRREIRDHLRTLKSVKTPLIGWPETDSKISKSIFACCVSIFLRNEDSKACRAALRDALSMEWYHRTEMLLSFVRHAHDWTEANPDLKLEPDLQRLIDEHHGLAKWLTEHSEHVDAEYADAFRKRANAQDRTSLQRIFSTVEAEFSRWQATRISETDLALLMRIQTLAIQATKVGVLIADATKPDCPIVYCNSGFEEMTGYSSPEVLGGNCRFLQEDDRDQQGREIVRRAVQNGEACTVTLRNYRKDGRMFWNELSITPVHDTEGRLTHFVSIQSDVTERQDMMADLQRERALLEGIIRGVPDALILADLDQRITYCNPSIERAFGYHPDELLGLSTEILLVNPEDARKLNALSFHDDKCENLEPVSLKWRRKDGDRFPGELLGRIIRDGENRVVNYLLLVRDVTEPQRLLAQRQRWYRVLDALSDGTPMKDLLGLIVRQAEETRPGTFGAAMLLNEDKTLLQTVCAPNLPSGFLSSLRSVAVSDQTNAFGISAHSAEQLAVTSIESDANWSQYSEAASAAGLRSCWCEPIVSLTNEVLGTLVIYLADSQAPTKDDLELLSHSAQLAGIVIERSRATEDLAKSEERLRLALKATNDAIWDMDVINNRLWWNETFEEKFGAPDPSVPAFEWWRERIHPDDRGRVLSSQAKLMAGQGDNDTRWSTEYRFRRRDGTFAVIEDRALRSYDRAGRLVRLLGALSDMTARRSLEKEVLEIAAEESLRIGNDLHDGVGQELTGMGMLADALATSLARDASPSEHASQVKIIGKLNESIRRTLGQVRTLARGMNPVDVDREGLMSALSEMCDRIRELHGIRCRFDCDHPVLFRDNQTATQLYRIAQEATTNAVKHGRASKIVITLVANEAETVLRICDNGVGINKNDPPSRGMGLRTMDYRSALFGGQVTLSPGEQGGTEVACFFPRDSVI